MRKFKNYFDRVTWTCPNAFIFGIMFGVITTWIGVISFGLLIDFGIK